MGHTDDNFTGEGEFTPILDRNLDANSSVNVSVGVPIDPNNNNNNTQPQPIIQQIPISQDATNNDQPAIIPESLHPRNLIDKYKTKTSKFERLTIVFAVLQLLVTITYFLAGVYYPYFVYPAIVFGTILGTVYNLKVSSEPRPLHANAIICGGVSSIVFFAWLFSKSSYPFFITPSMVLSLPPVIHYIVLTYREKDTKWKLYVHTAVYLILNTMLFLIWLPTTCGPYRTCFPWYVITWGFFGIFLLAHIGRSFFPENKLRTHALILSDLNIMLFLIWRFTYTRFPWFLFPLAASVLIFVLHRGLLLRKQKKSNPRPVQIIVPSQNQNQNVPPNLIVSQIPSLYISSNNNNNIDNVNNNNNPYAQIYPNLNQPVYQQQMPPIVSYQQGVAPNFYPQVSAMPLPPHVMYSQSIIHQQTPNSIVYSFYSIPAQQPNNVAGMPQMINPSVQMSTTQTPPSSPMISFEEVPLKSEKGIPPQ